MKPGSIGWVDLTVDDAEGVRDFYRAVVGWSASPVDMGGYSDFMMETPGEGQAVAGICHKRGTNADLPSRWMIYIVVEDLDASLARAAELGGKTLVGPKSMGSSRYAVLEDPGGSVCALYQP